MLVQGQAPQCRAQPAPGEEGRTDIVHEAWESCLLGAECTAGSLWMSLHNEHVEPGSSKDACGDKAVRARADDHRIGIVSRFEHGSPVTNSLLEWGRTASGEYNAPIAMTKVSLRRRPPGNTKPSPLCCKPYDLLVHCRCHRKFVRSQGVVTLPNFIVIGAAKAGTTALYWYLAEHPEVFMSPVKETNYFAYGLDSEGQLLYGDPDVHRFPVKTLREYEELFANAGGAVAIGEASPIYLECPQAAVRIRQVVPAVKLICSLRHPVDRAYSDYQMYLLRRGRPFDPERELTAASVWAQPDSHWMQIGKYHDQLKRYLDTFPRDQMHVFLFDDFKRNALQTVQGVYRFVGVDPGFEPDFATPHNVGGIPANRLLEGVFTSRSIRSAVKPWMPTRAVNWIRRLRMKNMRQAPPLPVELRKDLTRHFYSDMVKTSELIGRSLDHWL
jgi:hypothetical protein